MLNKSALYVRVSTSMQIDKDSLPFQRKELINYSKYILNIDDYEIFEDAGYSGKNTDRPKYQEMMQRMRKKEFSHILVWKIDRISRNLTDFTEMYDELKDYGVTFVSKNEQFDTSSAMGEAMLKIILVFAELERKLAGERVFSIMLSRAEKGLWNGATVPLGYKWSDEKKFPVVDDSEAPTVKYIYDLYEKNGSTVKVAAKLNDERVGTKRGGKWTPKTVGDILRNPFYIGTYRYNYKTGGKRRMKDEKEWVVVENNHEGIVSKEQYEKVNRILTENFRGNSGFQRSNINTHVFARMITCGKCGAGLSAGLDVARKDGYRPSRYTCYSNQYTDNIHSCGNFISDVMLMPFMLNYVSNFIKLQDELTHRHSLVDVEKLLLKGKSFIDIESVEKKGLEDTYIAFASGYSSGSVLGNIKNIDSERRAEADLRMQSLRKERDKYEKALSRLQDLYLFSEETMSEKDYLFKQRDLSQHLEKIKADIESASPVNQPLETFDMSFLEKANNFLLRAKLMDKRHIDYRELLKVVDLETIREVMQGIVKAVVVSDKKVSSITFVNGITHSFKYKPPSKRKTFDRKKFQYRDFEPDILKYLDENGSFARAEIEALTGMSRSGATSIINELLEREVIERRGHSIAIRYFKKVSKLDTN